MIILGTFTIMCIRSIAKATFISFTLAMCRVSLFWLLQQSAYPRKYFICFTYGHANVKVWENIRCIIEK